MKTSIRWASGQRNLLEKLDIDIERCFHEAGISREQWSDSSVFIDEALLHRFYEKCLEAYDCDPFIGILMGEQLSLQYTGYLGLALVSAPTYGDAIQLTVDFPRITGLAFCYSNTILEDEYVLSLAPKKSDYSGLFEFFCNYNVAGIYKTGREMADSSSPINKVRFMHTDTKNQTRYEKHFDCDIGFGADRNEVFMPIERLTAIPPRSDPEIYTLMYERCKALNSRLSADEKFSDKIERILLTSESDAWSINDIASQLYVSTRTLKRRLEAEDTNFTELISRFRESLAKEYLLHSQLKVDSIALKLGYSSGSSFGQAFKQWVGMSPSEYKEQHEIGS